MPDEVKLLPCPFCASDDIGRGIVREHSLTSAAVHCKRCGGAVLTIAGEKEAVRRWNTRAIEATRPTEQGLGVPTSVPNAALAGADDWEVGPCLDRTGRHVTSWDINIRPQQGDRGVAVIASVYSGETVARAILAAIQTAAVASRRAALTRMVQLDEELGLYDDEPVAALGTLTEGGDVEQTPGDSLNGPTLEDGDAHE